MPSQKFLDMLGNPINVGDTVVYPAAAGSSAAQLHTAVVTEIVPISPKDPLDPSCAFGYTSTGTGIDSTRRSLVRRQVPGTDVIETAHTGITGYAYTSRRYQFEYDPDRLFLLRVRRVKKGLSDPAGKERPGVMLKNIDRVVVVTSLLTEA